MSSLELAPFICLAKENPWWQKDAVGMSLKQSCTIREQADQMWVFAPEETKQGTQN